MYNFIKQHSPESVKSSWRSLKLAATKLQHQGTGRFCPVCEKTSRIFQTVMIAGFTYQDYSCIHCGAVDRHRLAWLYLTRRTDLFDGKPKRVLHVAPEGCFECRLTGRPGLEYITADLMSPGVMVKMDITRIQYPDESFDVILCSHVLEHVPDDRKAMREFQRVLKRTGWAILLVPINAPQTFEDPSITDPQERLRLFGQEDHVRKYGPDYLGRLQDAGFEVSVTSAADLAPEDERLRMGLGGHAGDIYYCEKRAA